MKKAFSLFETLLVLLLSSIVIIYFFKFSTEIYKQEKNNYQNEIQKIDLNATKIFLQKNIKEIDNLEYKNNTLYFKNSVLLENIKEFSIKKGSDFIEVELKHNEKISQKWLLKL